jgi:hypothetical protein
LVCSGHGPPATLEAIYASVAAGMYEPKDVPRIVPIAGEGRSDPEWTNGNQISLNSRRIDELIPLEP